MTTEITSIAYENGKRIEVQRVIYDKSDDLFALANLQRRYENICKQIDGAVDGTYLDNLRAEKEKLKSEIEEKEKIIADYEKTE